MHHPHSPQPLQPQLPTAPAKGAQYFASIPWNSLTDSSYMCATILRSRLMGRPLVIQYKQHFLLENRVLAKILRQIPVKYRANAKITCYILSYSDMIKTSSKNYYAIAKCVCFKTKKCRKMWFAFGFSED